MTSILWLRRDLRRADHPALGAAAADPPVVPLFVLDPDILKHAGAVRFAWLAHTLRALDESYDGRLCLRYGKPATVVPALAKEVNASAVHVSTETEPGGAQRDAAVRARLEADDVAWVETGSPYAVTPGRVKNQQGDPYRVFTPFSRAWREHGWRGPAEEPKGLTLKQITSEAEAWQRLDKAAGADDLPDMPPAGEAAAMQRWHEFLAESLSGYSSGRNRADTDGTSRLSVYLKFGVVHPRTLLHDVENHHGKGAERFSTELAWREFYADVLFHNPQSEWGDLRPALETMTYDEDDERVQAWREGRTGYPWVDAGMRQLLATGWMHNRLRMATASFLVKHLHHRWQTGAEHFLNHLEDGDLASNNHGWQWVAGTGTDAAPYFRIFNPVTQGEKFDPDGDYVRQWVPELRHLAGAKAHTPWDAEDGYDQGYPPRMLDLATERGEALSRYAAATGR